MIPYKVDNSVGKMNTQVYTEEILPQILSEFKAYGLTLYQDADSAHTSKGTTTWAKKNNLSLLTGPGVSLDLSILESLAHPIKRKFHAQRCTTQEEGLERFKQVFYNELDQELVQSYYEWYTKRLHECLRAKLDDNDKVGGQMTRY
jgi:transposase InsO family protein